MSPITTAPRLSLNALQRQPAHNIAAALVRNERAKHLAAGFDAAHDDLHCEGELIAAATSYAYLSRGCAGAASGSWPWCEEVPFRGVLADRFENLVKATALLHAEIERLLRASQECFNAAVATHHANRGQSPGIIARHLVSDDPDDDPTPPLPSNPDQAHPPRRAA